jgi:hypothetical protein
VCARCAFLDGSTSLERRIIEVMRQEPGGFAISELIEPTQASARSLQRALARLVGLGRMRRYWEEGAIVDLAEGVGYGKRINRLSNAGRWIYALNG